MKVPRLFRPNRAVCYLILVLVSLVLPARGQRTKREHRFLKEWANLTFRHHLNEGTDSLKTYRLNVSNREKGSPNVYPCTFSLKEPGRSYELNTYAIVRHRDGVQILMIFYRSTRNGNFTERKQIDVKKPLLTLAWYPRKPYVTLNGQLAIKGPESVKFKEVDSVD